MFTVASGKVLKSERKCLSDLHLYQIAIFRIKVLSCSWAVTEGRIGGRSYKKRNGASHYETNPVIFDSKL